MSGLFIKKIIRNNILELSMNMYDCYNDNCHFRCIYMQDLYKIRQRTQGLGERGGGGLRVKISLGPKLKK